MIRISNRAWWVACTGAVMSLAILPARGTLMSSPDAWIPDGDLSGVASTLNVVAGDVGGAPAPGIVDLNITLNLLGGWNGDLYAYLSHGGAVAVLLNRPGRTAGNPAGYSDSGFDAVTLDDAAANEVHLYGDVSLPIPAGSTWKPDGRAVNPLSVLDTDPRVTSPLAVFNGMDPTGEWVLFVADVAGGDQAKLESWSLSIEVPEPGSMGLLLFAFAGACAMRRRRERDLA
jgi:hypothetical protein